MTTKKPAAKAAKAAKAAQTTAQKAAQKAAAVKEAAHGPSVSPASPASSDAVPATRQTPARTSTGDSHAAAPAVRLQFNERLVSTNPAKPIAVSELVRRLQDLHGELKHLENPGADTPPESLAAVCKELVSKSLLHHKDKGVRILTACCLAELLRLNAPHVPFDVPSFRAVFELFFQLIPGVTDSKHAYFALSYELLECLNAAKSFTLVSKLNADELVVAFFDNIFKAVRQDMSQSVIVCLLDLLQQVIEDSQYLHHDIIDILLAQLSPSQKAASPTAHQIACELCQASADKLQRYVCQYFSDILVAAGKNVTDDTNPEQFRAAHRLIIDIYRAAPDILLNVIPQLEEELKVDALPMRMLALTSLGEMLVQSGGTLIAIYPSVWKSWCDRRNDKNVTIRVEWIKYCAWVVSKHQQVFVEVKADLQQKLMDPDERVRVEAIKAIGTIGSEYPHLLDMDTLKALTMRCRDKKSSVRSDAIEVVAGLYNHLHSLSQQLSTDAPGEHGLESYAWLAGDLLELLYLSDPETTILVEKAVCIHLLPQLPNDKERVQRIITLLHYLNEKQHKAFLSILSRRANSIYEMGIFIQQCERYNGGIMDADAESIEKGLNTLVAHMSGSFPDPKKAQTLLHKFASVNDRRVYQLIRAIMNPQSDFKRIVRDQKELQKRLEQHGGSLAETFAVLQRRVSLALVGRTTIETLMQMLHDARRGLQEDWFAVMENTAKQLMRDVATHFPAVYQTQIQSFVEIIVPGQEGAAVGDALEALARYLKTFPQDAPKDAAVVAKLQELALSGSPEQAKHAMIALAQGKHTEACTQTVQTIVSNLSLDNDKLVAHLLVLNAAARYAYQTAYRPSVMPIMNFIIKQVLLANRSEPSDDALDWIEYSDLDKDGKVKILCLKLAVKPLLSMADGEEDSSKMDLAKPALKLLRSVLDNAGEIASSGPSTSPAFKSHLRLTAGICMLKLSRRKQLRPLLDAIDTKRTALLVQDPVFYVRNAFATKLCAFIQSAQVPSDYVIMLMLMAHEPDVLLKSQIKSFVCRRAKQMRAVDDISNSPLLENTFGGLLHLVSHHPDFSAAQDDLESAEGYLQFFLDSVSTAENVALLYSIAAKLKTVSDKHALDSDKLYVISEVAQVMIHDRASSNSWTLQSWPGRVPLSSKLFDHLPLSDASANIKRAYLDQDFIKGRSQRSRTPVKRSAAHDTSFRSSAAPSPVSTPSRRTDSATKRKKSMLTGGSSDEEQSNSDDDASASPVAKRKALAGGAGGARQTPRQRRLSKETELVAGQAATSGSGARGDDAVTPLRRSSRAVAPAKPVVDGDDDDDDDDDSNDDADDHMDAVDDGVETLTAKQPKQSARQGKAKQAGPSRAKGKTRVDEMADGSTEQEDQQMHTDPVEEAIEEVEEEEAAAGKRPRRAAPRRGAAAKK
ncbi:armadillo-type protein [Entophlyctis helioformis]|nr:armadillo-type protein [Entophlyctis helioformis]